MVNPVDPFLPIKNVSQLHALELVEKLFGSWIINAMT